MHLSSLGTGQHTLFVTSPRLTGQNIPVQRRRLLDHRSRVALQVALHGTAKAQANSVAARDAVADRSQSRKQQRHSGELWCLI